MSNVESNGSHVIAEYDGNNNLLRKYIYGPGIDQPVSMIEVADNNAAYYYHYDALGSVIALSDSSGDTVQTYEYSVFGEPAVEDANHTNPYMFAGRRYDIEIGLYYNRARYYNPYTGRFLQTDPIGYGDGMNWYAYCGNNPLSWVDPSGRIVGRYNLPPISMDTTWEGFTGEQMDLLACAFDDARNACNERIKEINHLLGSMNCTAHERKDCNAVRELESFRDSLREMRSILDTISDGNFPVSIIGEDLGQDSGGWQGPWPDSYRLVRGKLWFNTDPNDPMWGDADALGEVVIHEIAHMSGLDHDGPGDVLSKNCDMYDEFMYYVGTKPIADSQWYEHLRKYCFIGEDEP